MSYKVIVDSCGELTAEMKASGRFETASLGLEVGDCHIIDDESFNQAEFLKNVAECPTCPKSSCPSPETFMEGYHCDAEHVYAVTLSSELSGSYNSAVLGKNLYEEEYGEKDIYVFNSKSASVGQTLIGMKIAQCEERGMTFKEVVAAVEAYIEEQHTYFVLETLETLRKNGRLTGLKAIAATVLNIKPVMEGVKGVIQQAGQARGMQKALRLMVELLKNNAKNPEEKVAGLVHCNNAERAEAVKAEILKTMKVKDVVILESSGVSTLYADQGGIILVL